MKEAAKSSVIRRLIRWLVLVASIVVALLYLYSSIHIVWVSGASPDPFPPGVYRRALVDLCYALAALSFGLGLFRGIRTFPWATGGSAAFIVLGALLALGPYIGRFVWIHDCLDRGGLWNKAMLQCSNE